MLKYFYCVLLLAGCLGSHTALSQPKLTFFSQLEAHQLEAQFADSVTMSQLRSLNASVALGTLDFHEKRARTIWLLNQWDIPVTAWLLLSRADHYYLHANNAHLAEQRYEALKVWLQKNNLKVDRIGFSVEPDLKTMHSIHNRKKGTDWLKVIRHFQKEETYAAAQYQSLIEQMRKDSFEVETYISPYLLNSEDSLFHKFMGVMDLDSDKKVPLLFSHHLEGEQDHYIGSYAQTHSLKSIAVGKTSKTFSRYDTEPFEANNWAATRADLESAYNYVDDIYLYSLEGCLRQHMLDSISNIHWSKNPPAPQPINLAAAAAKPTFLANFHPFQYPLLSLGVFLLICVLAAVAFVRVLRVLLG